MWVSVLLIHYFLSEMNLFCIYKRVKRFCINFIKLPYLISNSKRLLCNASCLKEYSREYCCRRITDIPKHFYLKRVFLCLIKVQLSHGFSTHIFFERKQRKKLITQIKCKRENRDRRF